jgi:DNA-binding transcriptional regulator YiaG
MGKIEKIVKSEIQRLAKREIRAAFFPLRREVYRMRSVLSQLSRKFNPMERMVKEQMRSDESKKLKMEASLEEAKASRITPERIRSLRQKLEISQRDLAILVGVSLGAVAAWEKGKFQPNLNKKARLVAVRKLRKRDIKKILAGKKEEMKKKKPQAKKRRTPRGKRQKK